MLKKSGRTIAALIAVFVLAALPISTASAGVVCDPITKICSSTVDNPGDPGSSDPKPGPGGFTPGPTECKMPETGKKIPCAKDGSPWNADKACYVKLASPQKAPPPGEDAAKGAWYTCSSKPGNCPADPSLPCGSSWTDWWSNTPPPGIVRLTPAQAAAQLVKTFQLRGIDIGVVPRDKPGSIGTVGLPVWLWVNNPQPLTFGPYSQTATLGGITITAVAKVSNVVWDMGDGHSVDCATAGTPWNGTNTSSPDCGYRYDKQSAGQPGDAFQVTATSNWAVTWSGGGENGVIPIQTVSRTQLQIGEIQTLIKG